MCGSQPAGAQQEGTVSSPPCPASASPGCQIRADGGMSCPNPYQGAGQEAAQILLRLLVLGSHSQNLLPPGRIPQGDPFLPHLIYKTNLNDLQLIKQCQMQGARLQHSPLHMEQPLVSTAEGEEASQAAGDSPAQPVTNSCPGHSITPQMWEQGWSRAQGSSPALPPRLAAKPDPTAKFTSHTSPARGASRHQKSIPRYSFITQFKVQPEDVQHISSSSFPPSV